jgi:hypothetical protein
MMELASYWGVGHILLCYRRFDKCGAKLRSTASGEVPRDRQIEWIDRLDYAVGIKPCCDPPYNTKPKNKRDGRPPTGTKYRTHSLPRDISFSASLGTATVYALQRHMESKLTVAVARRGVYYAPLGLLVAELVPLLIRPEKKDMSLSLSILPGSWAFGGGVMGVSGSLALLASRSCSIVNNILVHHSTSMASHEHTCSRLTISSAFTWMPPMLNCTGPMCSSTTPEASSDHVR